MEYIEMFDIARYDVWDERKSEEYESGSIIGSHERNEGDVVDMPQKDEPWIFESDYEIHDGRASYPAGPFRTYNSRKWCKEERCVLSDKVKNESAFMIGVINGKMGFEVFIKVKIHARNACQHIGEATATL